MMGIKDLEGRVPTYSTFVFRHKCETDARRVFKAIMRRWPMLTEGRTVCTAWGEGDTASVADAARMALESRAMDSSERQELALDLLNLTTWGQCLAKFAEWDLEIEQGELVDRKETPTLPLRNPSNTGSSS